VIIGDANMSELSTYLKLGTIALVLAMIEERFLDGDLALETPVAECRPSRTTRPAGTWSFCAREGG
jgi:Pup amidohydrolase